MKLVLIRLKMLLQAIKQQKPKTDLEQNYKLDALTAVNDLIRKYELLIAIKEQRDAKDGLDK